MLMWDSIQHMSNSQTTNSEMYQTMSRIKIMNFSGTWSILHQNLQSRKQPPDTCRLLHNNHQSRPYRSHPGNAHRPPPHHCRRWIIRCQPWHLVLLVPNKARILATGPWCPWPFIQAHGVASRNMLQLRLIPNLQRQKWLKEERRREVSTSSGIHGLEKLQNKRS